MKESFYLNKMSIQSQSFIRNVKIVTDVNIYSCVNFIDYKSSYTESLLKLEYPNKNDGLLDLFGFYMELYNVKNLDIGLMEKYANSNPTRYIYADYYRKLKDYNLNAVKYIYAFECILKTHVIVHNSCNELLDEAIYDLKYNTCNVPTFLYHHGTFLRIAYFESVIAKNNNELKFQFIENHFKENYPIKNYYTFIEKDNKSIVKREEKNQDWIHSVGCY